MSEQMQQQETQPQEFSMRVVLAGRTFAGLSGLEEAIKCLDAAAAVRPAEGDGVQDVFGFKFACAFNADRLRDAVAGRLAQMRTMTEPTAEWLEASGQLAALLGQHEVPMRCDDLVALVMEIGGCRESFVAQYGEENLRTWEEALAGALAQWRPAMERRAEVIVRCGEAMNADEVARVAVVAFPRIPRALTGGYIRDLLWMFEEVPEPLLALAAGAAGAAGAACAEGIDA